MESLGIAWRELSASARVSVVAGAALIAALAAAGFFWLASEEYRTLFTDLQPRDAAGIVAELERLKIDYEVDESGGEIRVPASLVHEARLKLMGSDVALNGGVGFEIFDNSDFGMTEFALRINYQRALEGELTRTIASLKEVKYARVHLVIPKEGLFRQQSEPPSASVTLFLKQAPAQALYLDSDRIAGIQRLVAAAVPGLSAGRVTVTDQAGRTLSQQMPADRSVAAVSERLRQKRSIEKYLTDKAQQVLDRTFGAGQAMVSVDADLDFSEIKRTRENVLPAGGEGGIVRRRETRQAGPAAEQNTRDNVTTEVEYQLGRSVEQWVERPGDIRRLTVGVIVPSDTADERRREIRELVEMAVGMDSSRGDAVAVYAISQSMRALSAAQSDIPWPPVPAESALASEPDFTDQPALDRSGGEFPAWGDADPLAWINNREPLTLAVCAAIAALLALFAVFFRRRRSGEAGASAPARGPTAGAAKASAIEPVLSEGERERALLRIRGWLDKADATGLNEELNDGLNEMEEAR